MVKIGNRYLGMGVLTFAVSATSVAAPAVDEGQWMSEAFGGTAANTLEILSAQEMASTRGKFAPMFGYIAAVAAVDFALAGFFWGVYIPQYGGGGCTTCYLPPFPR
mgnify:CR=1 FL=1